MRTWRWALTDYTHTFGDAVAPTVPDSAVQGLRQAEKNVCLVYEVAAEEIDGAMTLRWIFFPGGSPCLRVTVGTVIAFEGKGTITIVA
jgi:hypothetical protein